MEKLESKEELVYLMRFISNDIDELVEKVLGDSETDPHYSAVTAQNLILCYIQIMRELNIKLPFHNVASYFQACHYSEADYEQFERKRVKESVYYVGKQFIEQDRGRMDSSVS